MSGLRDSYLQVYKKHKKKTKIISIHIIDSPENILKRLTFYDIDSNLLNIKLNDNEKKKYLKSIKGDITYFKKSLSRADLQISIENVPLGEITELINNC